MNSPAPHSARPFNPANALIVIADEPRLTRSCDLDRLRDDVRPANWPSMKAWLLAQDDIPARTRAELLRMDTPEELAE